MMDEGYKVAAKMLHELVMDIYKELGAEDPENWTRDTILNQIKELKKKEALKLNKRTDIHFSELPFEYKKALQENCYINCESIEAAGDFYKDSLFTVEIISTEEAKKRCMQYSFAPGKFDSFEEFHQWFLNCRKIPDYGDSVYPVIYDGDEQWIADGWARFHSYVKYGKKEIPVLYIQS